MTDTYNWHDIERKAMHFSVTWATEEDERSEVLSGFYRFQMNVLPKKHVNNSIFPTDPSASAQQAVEAAAQSVLDVRAKWQSTGKTLAHLYDPDKMPADLLAAHQTLDRAVDGCYGIRKGFGSEGKRVGWLFGRWENYKKI